MPLFDNVHREGTEGKPYGEDIFSYYDRIARPDVGRIRDRLEEWLARYPDEHRDELENRLRSAEFDSAFFELFLHELLICLGCRLDVHPEVGSRSRQPDFLATPDEGSPFLVEATLARDESQQEAAVRRVAESIIDSLNRIDLPGFLLNVDVIRVGAQPPARRRLKAFLRDALAGLDQDLLRAARTDGSEWSAVPPFRFVEGSTIIEFRPILWPESVADPQPGSVGMHSIGGAVPVKPAGAVRKALERKAGRYGELELPFVIAINCIAEYLPRDRDLLEALFGEVRFTVTTRPNGRTEEAHIRAPNGLWHGPRGERYTRVSAVLAAVPVIAFNVPSAPICLYKNPWAAIDCTSPLDRLPRCVREDDGFEHEDGATLGQVMGIPPGWPQSDS